MLLAEEKVSWLLELSENPLFSRGDSDVNLVFELDDWVLILAEGGGHLIYLPIAVEWFEYTKSFQVLAVLEKLPETKTEFYSMLEQIKKDGELIKNPTDCRNIVYLRFLKNRMSDCNLAEILKDFDLKSALNEREQFKFAAKKELNKDSTLSPKLIIFEAILNFIILVLFFLSFSKWSIFNITASGLATNVNSYINLFYVAVLFIALSFLCHFIFIFFLRKIRVNRIFKSIDKLGTDFYNLSLNRLSKELKIDIDTVMKINNKKIEVSKNNFIN